MLLRKPLLFLLFLVSFLNTSINAQNFELGKVSITELEEKQHPKDPSAVAAILFDKGEVHFSYNQTEGFFMTLEVKTRIKIYKKEGYEWANQEIEYSIENNFKEAVSFSDAITYNLVNGKIEKNKLKSEGEFDEKINKYRGQRKITMPNVREGSVIEYKYTIKSSNIGSLRDWNFQTSIPVNHSEFKTYIPEYFTYNPSQKGYVFPKVSVELTNQTINFTYKDSNVSTYSMTGGGTASYKSLSQELLQFVEKRTTYTADNLPAMKDEGYVNNIDNYTSSISNELSTIQYPNSIMKVYSASWEDLAKTIYKYDDFGPELDKNGYFEDDIKALTLSLNTQNEKIAAIFNFVKSNIKWNGYYGYWCNEGVRKAHKDKTGNVAEINLMLTAMMRYSGINANPVILSTRSNGIALFPYRTAFNYVIAAVETPEGLILLDATEKFSAPNMLPLRDINWLGRLIRKDGTSVEVDLTPKILSREVTNMSVVLKNDGSADGKIRRQLTDHEALAFRQKNLLTAKDAYLEELENRNNAIEISDYVRDNELDLSKPIIESYSFKDTKDVEIIDNKIYISPLLFLNPKENPFKQQVREYPVDFGYPIQNKYNISIEIPDGYIVESIPKAVNISTSENIGAFKYIIGNTGNTIQIIISEDINTAIVLPNFYDVLKDFYQKMIDKQSEKIVLKKL